LADISLATPKGIIKDVLVQVGQGLLDVPIGKLKMRLAKVEILKVYKALKLPSSYEELSAIIVVELDSKSSITSSVSSPKNVSKNRVKVK
ncbi:hypothetical protein HAX54_017911, partial [Datura stramonium]|nr:hypothetical protein [Datura stramonium]